MTLLLVIFVLSGLLLVALAIPLIRGKVGPNSWYGFRVPQTLGDPNVWYPVNRYAAKGMLWLGLATCAAAVLLYLVPEIDLVVYSLTVLAVNLVGLTVNLVLTFR